MIATILKTIPLLKYNSSGSVVINLMLLGEHLIFVEGRKAL